MQLSEQAIEEFKEIYKKEFGEELSDIVAATRALNFLELFKLVYSPFQNNENKKTKSSEY